MKKSTFERGKVALNEIGHITTGVFLLTTDGKHQQQNTERLKVSHYRKQLSSIFSPV